MGTWSVPLVSITLQATLLEQRVINQFYYGQTGPGTLEALSNIADEFETLVVEPIQTIQSHQLQYDTIRVFEFGEPFDFEKDISGLQGDFVTDSLPSFQALNFKLVRWQTDVRNGSKRIAGIPQGALDGNDLETSYGNIVALMEAVFSIRLFPGDPSELTPVIYRRDSFEVEVWDGTTVTNSFFTAPTTQRSRKAGAGI